MTARKGWAKVDPISLLVTAAIVAALTRMFGPEIMRNPVGVLVSAAAAAAAGGLTHYFLPDGRRW